MYKTYKINSNLKHKFNKIVSLIDTLYAITSGVISIESNMCTTHNANKNDFYFSKRTFKCSYHKMQTNMTMVFMVYGNLVEI